MMLVFRGALPSGEKMGVRCSKFWGRDYPNGTVLYNSGIVHLPFCRIKLKNEEIGWVLKLS
jgi:hypothetical protein